MGNRTGVVTPEGVFLDYRPAGLATRAVGRMVDISVQIMIAYVVITVFLTLITATSTSGTQFVIATIAVSFVILFGYPILFEVYGGGRTPGHRATGTRVIKTDGGPLRFRHAAIRSMLFLVDGLGTSGFAGAVSVLVTKRGQRLGDLAAGTMVVRLDTVGAWDNPSHAVPSGLRERSAKFDTRRLDQTDIAISQMLLERGADLFPGAQLDLATRIASRLDDKLGSVKLDSDRPADFIAAVVGANDQVWIAETQPVPPTPYTTDATEPGSVDPIGADDDDPTGFAAPS